MMILSNSYVVTEDFITSVRDNLEILEHPEPFKDFLTYVTLMDSSVATGLRRMEAKVNNPYFSQWIDALVLAQDDRSLKYVTVTVVDSMHDVLSVQAESDAAMYAVWRDYLMTLIMIFSVPLIFKFTLADAYLTLTGSLVGQSMFILLLAAVIFSVFRALKINKRCIYIPVETADGTYTLTFTVTAKNAAGEALSDTQTATVVVKGNMYEDDFTGDS